MTISPKAYIRSRTVLLGASRTSSSLRARRWLLGLSAIAIACALVLSSSASAQPRCGIERWSVKTGADGDAESVSDPSSPQDITIAAMNEWHGGVPFSRSELNDHEDSRIGPQEITIWRVRGTLTAFKVEGSPTSGDQDYHLVIADGDATIVAEIPWPGCVAEGSRFKAAIRSARSTFDRRFHAKESFTTVAVPVEIIGPAFFDFLHNQRGHANNVVEIHPVLQIAFLDTQPPPSPAPAASPPPVQPTPAEHAQIFGTWVLQEVVSTASGCRTTKAGDTNEIRFVLSRLDDGTIQANAVGNTAYSLYAGLLSSTGTFSLVSSRSTGTSTIQGTIASDTLNATRTVNTSAHCAITWKVTGQKLKANSLGP